MLPVSLQNCHGDLPFAQRSLPSKDSGYRPTAVRPRVRRKDALAGKARAALQFAVLGHLGAFSASSERQYERIAGQLYPVGRSVFVTAWAARPSPSGPGRSPSATARASPLSPGFLISNPVSPIAGKQIFSRHSHHHVRPQQAHRTQILRGRRRKSGRKSRTECGRHDKLSAPNALRQRQPGACPPYRGRLSVPRRVRVRRRVQAPGNAGRRCSRTSRDPGHRLGPPGIRPTTPARMRPAVRFLQTTPMGGVAGSDWKYGSGFHEQTLAAHPGCCAAGREPVVAGAKPTLRALWTPGAR